MNIHFYHLLSTPLERALPKLVEKAYHAKFCVLIRAGDAALAERVKRAVMELFAEPFPAAWQRKRRQR